MRQPPLTTDGERAGPSTVALGDPITQHSGSALLPQPPGRRTRCRVTSKKSPSRGTKETAKHSDKSDGAHAMARATADATAVGAELPPGPTPNPLTASPGSGARNTAEISTRGLVEQEPPSRTTEAPHCLKSHDAHAMASATADPIAAGAELPPGPTPNPPRRTPKFRFKFKPLVQPEPPHSLKSAGAHAMASATAHAIAAIAGAEQPPGPAPNPKSCHEASPGFNAKGSGTSTQTATGLRQPPIHTVCSITGGDSSAAHAIAVGARTIPEISTRRQQPVAMQTAPHHESDSAHVTTSAAHTIAPAPEAASQRRRPWSQLECLFLLEAKKARETRPSVSPPSALEAYESIWINISNYLKRLHINRNPSECKSKWGNLKKDFKIIKAWEGLDEENDFWKRKLTTEERKKHCLPRCFDRKVYEALNCSTKEKAREMNDLNMTGSQRRFELLQEEQILLQKQQINLLTQISNKITEMCSLLSAAEQ